MKISSRPNVSGEIAGDLIDIACICSATRAAARKLTSLYDAHLVPTGLNIAQYRLMTCIENVHGSTSTELATMLGLDRSTIGRNIGVLKKHGLVKEGPSSDGRESLVALTDFGANALVRARPLWKAAQDQVQEKIGAVEIRAFASILRSLA